MALLFSSQGIERLDAIVKSGMLCAFDFDGTLAPIVMHPDDARLPAALLTHLFELSSYASIAVITGRSIADIRPRLGFEPTYLIGNHGLEGVPDGDLHLAEQAMLCHHWLTQLTPALHDIAVKDPGIQIENKNYSLSVHYRLTRIPEESALRLATLFDTLEPTPHIIGGKYVFNLLPMNAASKGSALAQLMQISAAPSAIYVGDDVTDEDVFRLRRRDILSIRIEDAPSTAAEFYLERLDDMRRLIDELILRLKRYQAEVSQRPKAMHGV